MHALKQDVGPLSLSRVLQEIDKLERIQQLGLPADLFAHVSAKTLDSYRHLLRDEPFGRYLANSLIVASCVAAFDVAVSSMAAYALARIRFAGREALFFLVLTVMIIPFEALLVPLYLIVRWLGWVDSYAALIVPMVPRAFSIFLLRQFFRGLPRELDDAARIDGCRDWGIYWHIMLPLSRPVLLSVTLLTFQEMWGSFTWPLVSTNNANMRVVQVAVASFGQGDHWRMRLRSKSLECMRSLPRRSPSCCS